jgi:pyridoxine/pyridoxamine 5'-phosphate oxidase
MMDRRELHRFMVQHKLGVVSTIGPDGTPQSALVGVATTPDLEIVFDTLKSSRKYGNLVAQPRCSVVIGWSGEQTVQFEGIAEEPKGAELERLQRVYFEAWPDGPTRLSWPGITYFVIRPRWIRYSDFAQNPPLIVEL